jgi:hypothetical protein
MFLTAIQLARTCLHSTNMAGKFNSIVKFLNITIHLSMFFQTWLKEHLNFNQLARDTKSLIKVKVLP